MEDFRTEEEQIEAIKRWWDENGKSTIVAIVLAVAVSFGWRYWQDQQQAHKEAGSMVYAQLLELLSEPQLSADQQANVSELSSQLQNEHSGSGYAVLAGLASARVAMDNNDFDAAAAQLSSLQGTHLSKELAALVNVRLAKVLFSQQKYDEAIKTLGGDMQKFTAQSAELRGDILAAQGNSAAAQAAYQEAQTSGGADGMLQPSPLLRIKLESIASAAGDQG